MGLAPVTVLIMLLWWFGTQFVVIALIVVMSIGVDWAWDRSEAPARGSAERTRPESASVSTK